MTSTRMTFDTQEQEDLAAIQKEYAEAVKRNQTARAHLQSLLQERQQQQHNPPQSRALTQRTHLTQPPLNSRTRHQNYLTTHLQNLRLQRQYDNLQTLAAYTEQFELLAERQRLYDDISLSIRYTSASAASELYSNRRDGIDDDVHMEHQRETRAENDIKTQQRRVDSLLDTSKELTSRLELALVGARLDLKRERAWLEAATRDADKLRSERSGAGTGQEGEEEAEAEGKRNSVTADRDSEDRKLRALQATRAELQKWIAETLKRCEEEQEPVQVAHNKAGWEDDGKELEQTTSSAGLAGDGAKLAANADMDVEAEYTRYIAARKRLLHLLEALKRPLPPLPPTTAASFNTIKTHSEHNTDNANTLSMKPTLPTASSGDKPQRPQHQHPPVHRNNSSRISLSYTTKTAEFTRGPSLAEIEAQHIPSYEHAKLTSIYLADVKRQTHALDVRLLEMLTLLSHESHLLPAYPSPSTYQGQSQGQAYGGANAVSARNKTMEEKGLVSTKKENKDVERLLAAWAFAADAADTKLRERVDEDVDVAEMALRGAEERLEEVRALEEMRGEVLGG